MSLITIDELEKNTGVPYSATQDIGFLTNLIDVVSEQIQAYCGTTQLTPVDYVDQECPAWIQHSEMVFMLRCGPVLALSGATWLWSLDHSRTAIDIDNVRIDPDTRFVYVPATNNWMSGPGRATIQALSDADNARILASYRAGYTSVPTPVKRAVALLVQEEILASINAGKGRTSPLQSFKIGNYSETYFTSKPDGGLDLGLGTELTRRAIKLLTPFSGARLVVS